MSNSPVESYPPSASSIPEEPNKVHRPFGLPEGEEVKVHGALVKLEAKRVELAASRAAAFSSLRPAAVSVPPPAPVASAHMDRPIVAAVVQEEPNTHTKEVRAPEPVSPPVSSPSKPCAPIPRKAGSKIPFKTMCVATAKLNLKVGVTLVDVDTIYLRNGANTRELSMEHVVDLAESITALSLLQPVVLDTAGHLLAGSHRFAALQILTETRPKHRRAAFLERCGWNEEDATGSPPRALAAFADRLMHLGDAPLAEHYPKNVVPVVVIDVSGQDGSDLALAIEAAENNVRRQYSRDEIIVLAQRFKAAGYRSSAGRPGTGEKTVLGALHAALGRSKRQIQRILNGPPPARPSAPDWTKVTAAFQRAAAEVIAAGRHENGDDAKAVVAVAAEAVKVLGGK